MKLFRLLALVGVGGAAAFAAVPALASSHAEAPLIAEDPQADNTDTYFFRSIERPDRVVVLANYIPLEEPSGGPTYSYFSDRVVYQINFDRNSDGRDDVSFQFRFKTRVQTPGTLLPYLGPITSLTKDGKTVATAANINPLYNRYQTYDLWMVNRSGKNARPVRIASNVIVPPNNAGSSTCPDFASLVTKSIHTVAGAGTANGIRTYCGQVDDPFYLDLGAIFDLLRVRPYRSLHALNGAIPLPDRANTPDALAGFNCHTIAMEIPITFLTKTAAIPGGADSKRVLGVYANAWRQRISVLRKGTVTGQGKFVQVSRLGAPLVNELFIPLSDPQKRNRDTWNMSDPSEDGKFRTFFQFPEPALRLAQLYPVLRPVVPNINANQTGFTGPRTDLLGGATPLLDFVPDFLRLDVSVAPNPNPNRLGALGGDTQGFPNGRRVGDDVVDIYMRAAAGALVPGNVTVGNFTGTRGAFLDAINFGDGVNGNDNGRLPFPNSFPFQATAHNGVNPAHNGFEDPEREETPG